MIGDFVMNRRSKEIICVFEIDGYRDVVNNEPAGFAIATSIIAPASSRSNYSSRLYLKSRALADYCGRQFADLWADFYLIRKKTIRKN